MKKATLFTFLFTLSVGALWAQTAPALKIGYTNIDYILSMLPESKQIEADYTAYEKQLSNQLQAKIADFQAKGAEYQKNYETMIPEVRADKEGYLRDLQTSIEKFQRDADASMQKKRNDLLSPAYEKIQTAIDKVAAENGYTHVFSSDIGGMPVLLYVRDVENDDISVIVLKSMGVIVPAETTTGN